MKKLDILLIYSVIGSTDIKTGPIIGEQARDKVTSKVFLDLSGKRDTVSLRTIEHIQ